MKLHTLPSPSWYWVTVVVIDFARRGEAARRSHSQKNVIILVQTLLYTMQNKNIITKLNERLWMARIYKWNEISVWLRETGYYTNKNRWVNNLITTCCCCCTMFVNLSGGLSYFVVYDKTTYSYKSGLSLLKMLGSKWLDPSSKNQNGGKILRSITNKLT